MLLNYRQTIQSEQMTGLIAFHCSDWSQATNQSDAGEGRASVAAAAGDGRAYQLHATEIGTVIRAPSGGSLIMLFRPIKSNMMP
jgi:hypothetical protein